MNCDNFKDIIILSIYGKTTPSEKQQLQEHMHECPRCAELYQQTADYHDLIKNETDIPLPNWEKSWRIISQKVKTRKQHRSVFTPSPRLALAGVAVCLVFLLGFFVGKKYYNPKSDQFSFLSIDNENISPIKSYVESLELLLVDFTNRDDRSREKEIKKLEVKLLTEILFQTRLLKLLVSEQGNPSLVQFLEDMELLLVSMSNLRPEDKEAADQLIQFIRENHLKNHLQKLADITTI